MPNIKKIVIIGPESTGKSTLTQALAEAFDEPWVDEYAREYLENLGRQYTYQDLLNIARGQAALEEEKAKAATKFLFCDTDLHVIQVWSNHKFGETHPWILQQIRDRPYDLYFLTSIDVPWQEDPLREHPNPEMRQYFFDIYHELLRASNTPFEVISGSPQDRVDQAIHHLKKFSE